MIQIILMSSLFHVLSLHLKNEGDVVALLLVVVLKRISKYPDCKCKSAHYIDNQLIVFVLICSHLDKKKTELCGLSFILIAFNSPAQSSEAGAIWIGYYRCWSDWLLQLWVWLGEIVLLYRFQSEHKKVLNYRQLDCIAVMMYNRRQNLIMR